jgi:hypothetical protein
MLVSVEDVRSIDWADEDLVFNIGYMYQAKGQFGNEHVSEEAKYALLGEFYVIQRILLYDTEQDISAAFPTNNQKLTPLSQIEISLPSNPSAFECYMSLEPYEYDRNCVVKVIYDGKLVSTLELTFHPRYSLPTIQRGKRVGCIIT